MSETFWVAVMGFLGIILAPIIHRWFDRRQAQHEQWREPRKNMYKRFFEGVDGCIQHDRDRKLYLYQLRNGQLGEFPDGQAPSFVGTVDIDDAVKKCAIALAEMRFFAPNDILALAQKFVERTRYIEHFGGLAEAYARVAAEGDGSNGDASDYSGDVPNYSEDDDRGRIAAQLLKAMRTDLGFRASDDVEFGDLSQPIPYL